MDIIGAHFKHFIDQHLAIIAGTAPFAARSCCFCNMVEYSCAVPVALCDSTSQGLNDLRECLFVVIICKKYCANQRCLPRTGIGRCWIGSYIQEVSCDADIAHGTCPMQSVITATVNGLVDVEVSRRHRRESPIPVRVVTSCHEVV